MNHVNKQGFSALMKAAEFSDINTVSLLLENGGNVVLKTCFGDTALHLACRSGSVDVADKLLTAGADLEARNNRDDTPFHLAAGFGRSDVVTLLLDKWKADIHSVSISSSRWCATVPCCSFIA